MIFEKTLMTLAAAAAIAAAAAVSVFAAAFALYAVLAPVLTSAGAAAVVAAVAAFVVAVAGLIAANRAEAGRARHAPPPEVNGFAERIVDIVKDRPILSIGAALAAGVFALKNPTFTAAVAQAFMASRTPPKR
ncbi:hypothetical protein G5B46_11370 [Caulobacter sp. 602-2]|uniref:Phage holin family protein n=2 Tax=Caulobacter sp. 602-2 TaxID=2710887 RepID=A0A6G4QZ47_9CAUL|nr:hypothetical protein [Caulobacter sp. 602-2]